MKWFLALSCLVFLPAEAAPQSASGLRLGFAPEAGKAVTPHTADLSVSHAFAPDHRMTGAIVGGVAGVGLGIYAVGISNGLREGGGQTNVGREVLTVLLCGAISAGIGALIGSMIPKGP